LCHSQLAWTITLGNEEPPQSPPRAERQSKLAGPDLGAMKSSLLMQDPSFLHLHSTTDRSFINFNFSQNSKSKPNKPTSQTKQQQHQQPYKMKLSTTYPVAISALTVFLAVYSGTTETDARLLRRRAATATTTAAKSDVVNRWASTGGGWRAMTSITAFANVFAQAGLLSNTSSAFTSVSTESGASWFSTQFFYSQPYYEATITSTPDELSDFILQWMNTYLNMTEALGTNPQCDILDQYNMTGLDIVRDYCNVFVYYNGDWAQFVNDMMEDASTAYGDSYLISRLASADNRVSALSSTDLYVQTSLTANSRIRGTSDSTAVYLGPSSLTSSSTNPQVYSAAIAVQYSVSDDETFYYSTVSEHGIDLEAYSQTVSNSFNFPNGYKEFGTFPATSQAALIDVPEGSTSTGSFVLPFGGGDAEVGQIAAASSAAIGQISPLTPSTLNQYLSVYQEQLQQNGTAKERLAFDTAVDKFYNNTLFDDISVCSQWPNKCGDVDGRFIDGYYTDSPTLALNIGQYQTREGGDLAKTLRVIVTNNNNYLYGPEPVLAYFNTSFNTNVSPGEFFWPSPSVWCFPIGILSPQIFEETLEMSDIDAVTESISGLNVTTAVLNGTTIDNPAFKTKAGQKVEILFISLNSFIPTDIIGVTEIEEYIQPLADMAKSISENQELVDRVSSFMNGDN
jgi:hypothetical protein